MDYKSCELWASPAFDSTADHTSGLANNWIVVFCLTSLVERLGDGKRGLLGVKSEWKGLRGRKVSSLIRWLRAVSFLNWSFLGCTHETGKCHVKTLWRICHAALCKKNENLKLNLEHLVAIIEFCPIIASFCLKWMSCFAEWFPENQTDIEFKTRVN